MKRSYRHRSKSNYVFKLPFGEEIASGIGGRNSAQGYGGQDSIRQKFTGYERDNESELDYAQARYYNFIHGRFTGVDTLLESAQPALPQAWNRYAYCLNNPLNSIDPTGMMTDFIDYQTGERTHIDDHKDQVITASTKQIKQFVDYWNKGNGNPDYRKEYYSSLGKLESRWNNLNLTVAQFDRLAQAVYAESSGGARESYGIVNVLENRAAADETDLMTQVSDEPGYRVNGVNSNAYFTEEGPAADQKRRNIHIGIARAIPGQDITNGAFFWDGRDFDKNARGNNSGWRLRHQSGYFFTDRSHDLYNQGSYKSPKFGYYYESTAAIGSTTFSRRYKYKGGSWR